MRACRRPPRSTRPARGAGAKARPCTASSRTGSASTSSGGAGCRAVSSSVTLSGIGPSWTNSPVAFPPRPGSPGVSPPAADPPGARSRAMPSSARRIACSASKRCAAPRRRSASVWPSAGRLASLPRTRVVAPPPGLDARCVRACVPGAASAPAPGPTARSASTAPSARPGPSVSAFTAAACRRRAAGRCAALPRGPAGARAGG